MLNIDKVDLSYISCACNRTPHCADWGYNGLVCYGSCHSVAIFDPSWNGGGKILSTLTGHKGRVNATKWVKKSNCCDETELVSVAADHCGLVWNKTKDSYVVSGILKGHEGSITAVDAAYQGSEGLETLVVVTASVDSTVRIWKRQPQQVTVCHQVLSLGSGICLSLSLRPLDCSTLLLACGLDDCHIHLYGDDEAGGELCRRQILKGHEDWVISLDFTTEDNGDILLASGSQDSTVRLWRFHPPHSHTERGHELFHVEESTLSLGSHQMAVGLESVLQGHDGRVYGVQWHPLIVKDGTRIQPLKLLTASLDKTVVVWAPETQSGVWLEEARMGEVGGNTLGFFGACFGPAGAAILAHGYQGGLHIWHEHEYGWRPGVVVGGHYDAVSDLAWEPTYGRYVLSVSSDQTTRLHAPWLSSPSRNQDHSWHEIARPQIHGYDLVCLAMLPSFRFVSGADEKVVRAFTAPQNFLENFRRLCLSTVKDEEDADKQIILPSGAAVPVLGLSNKAVFQTENDQPELARHVKDQYDDNSYFTPQHLTEPPTEDNLLQNTLWPETMKLYGHGYEVFSLATTADGTLLASSCKATNEEHAAILLWDTCSWQKVGRLISHQLTITQMQFSPNDRYLLSVSRDRRWSIFQRTESDGEKFKLIARTDKSTGVHSRIIWCCSWSHDSSYFATGSRDGKVVVWGKSEEMHPVLGHFKSVSEHLDLPKESITSVAFALSFVLAKEAYLVAVGSEAGDIRLYGWSKNSETPWTFLYQLSGNLAHHLAVKKLAFRPVTGRASQSGESPSEANKSSCTVLQLASCGLDHTVKICDLYIRSNKS